MKKLLRIISLSLLLITYGCNTKENQNDNLEDTSEESSDPIENYYKLVIKNLTGDSLLKSINIVIKLNVKVLSYSSDLYPAYSKTDVYPNTTTIWDLYSTKNYNYPTDENHGVQTGTYNREHMIPQSWFNGITTPIYSDLFNVYPTDSEVNAKRANMPHGDTNNGTIVTGSDNCKIGRSKYGNISQVFEVKDEYKGDIARTYLYAACRYYGDVGKWNAEARSVFVTGYPYFTDFGLTQYLSWHIQDPVSEKEIYRNNEVYKLQNNRNPFIDHPEWVESIWGSYM